MHLYIKISYINSHTGFPDVILRLPIHKDQVVSKQSTFGFWPEHPDQTAGVQAFIHVQSVSQLVYSLQTGRKRWDEC